MRGVDVKLLQEYLKHEGHLKGEVTGYFGAVTTRAVSAWQREHGITPSGTFGTRSRGYLGVRCQSKDVTVTRRINGEEFSATPSKGGAPLVVRFRAVTTDTSGLKVQFGDGNSEVFAMCAESYPMQCSLSHTYANVGTYQAHFARTVNGTDQLITSVMVVVTNDAPTTVTPGTPSSGGNGTPGYIGGYNPQENKPILRPKACTREYRPVCARPSGCDNTCTGTVCNASCKLFSPKVYSNKCTAESEGASYLHDGECTSASNRIF
jgi:peptidoglycan hydrolase-like protein with peptidoglycan-binding domain